MQVVVYSRPTCAPCHTVKYFLKKIGVAFTEKNIDLPEVMDEFSQLVSLPMVPLILIDGQMIQGANIPALKNALDAKALA